jgi:RNA-directed DNA polymerase
MTRLSSDTRFQLQLNQLAAVGRHRVQKVANYQPTQVTFCVRGVISPILSNLFLHYAFDLWMTRTHPDLPWCRYADDGLVHCRTEQEAEAIKASLQSRLSECQLELHPTKTRIVYCKVNGRRGMYPNVKFDFLGYCFRPRRVMQPSDRKVVGGFTPAVSPTAMKAMRAMIRDLNIRRSTQVTLADIARKLNPLLRGWIAYYGRYTPSALYALYRYVNRQSDATGVGATEVQALQEAQSSGGSFP